MYLCLSVCASKSEGRKSFFNNSVIVNYIIFSEKFDQMESEMRNSNLKSVFFSNTNIQDLIFFLLVFAEKNWPMVWRAQKSDPRYVLMSSTFAIIISFLKKDPLSQEHQNRFFFMSVCLCKAIRTQAEIKVAMQYQ